MPTAATAGVAAIVHIWPVRAISWPVAARGAVLVAARQQRTTDRHDRPPVRGRRRRSAAGCQALCARRNRRRGRDAHLSGDPCARTRCSAGLKAGAIREMSYAYEATRWDREKVDDAEPDAIPIRNLYAAQLFDERCEL